MQNSIFKYSGKIIFLLQIKEQFHFADLWWPNYMFSGLQKCKFSKWSSENLLNRNEQVIWVYDVVFDIKIIFEAQSGQPSVWPYNQDDITTQRQ